MVNDRYLTGEDYEFAKLVYDDIEKFVNCPGEKRALLFPAVNSRRRFLIHHTVADYFPNLASLSVGEGEQRRTAVTLKQQLEQHQLLQEKHLREEQLLREDEERERQRERQLEEAAAAQRGRNSQQEQQQKRRECSQESTNTLDRKQRNKQQQQHRNSPETHDSDASSRQQQQQRGKNRNNKENADGEERREPEKKEGRRRNRKRDKRGSSSALSLQQKEQEEQQGNNRNRRQHQQQQEQDDTRLKQNHQQQQSKNPRSGENFGGNPIRKSASSSAVLCPTEDGEGGCSSSEQPERKASKRRRRETKRRNRNNNEKNKKDGEEEGEEYEDRKGSRAQSRESSVKPKENAKHQEHLEVSSVNGERQSECHTSKGRRRGSRRSPSKSVPLPPESSGSEQCSADGELACQSSANPANSTAPSASSAGRQVKRSASSVCSTSHCECDPGRDGPERRDQRSTPERSKVHGSWRTGEGVASSPSPSSSSNASSRRGSSTQTADRSREEQSQNHHHPPFHHHHSQRQQQSYRRSSIGLVAPELTEQASTCNSYLRDYSPTGGKSSFSSSGCVTPVNMTADLEINNKVKRGKGVSAALYRPPAARRDGPFQPSSRVRLDSQGDLVQTSSTPTSHSASRPRAKRPDQQLYVPKGRRYGPHDAPTPDMEPRPPSPAYSVASESSGRNRYNCRSQQGSHLSIYDEDLDEHDRIHHDLRDLSRESTPAHGNNKGNPGAGLFSKQTLQLIERCMNQDRQDSWENSSVTSSPSPKNNRRYSNGGANVSKSPTPKRDLDSVHSKENVLLPNDQVPTKTRKNRRNRRRGSRSRDQLNDQSNKDQSSRTPQRNTPSNTPGSSEWVFYNSSYDYNNDRYDNRGYDNYDRYSSSRNNSKASSRNSSRERLQQYQHHQQNNSNPYTHLDWRNRGNNVNTSYSIPSSPAKGYTHPGYQHSRNSAKPPSGRLGSLPNVALDFGDTRRRSLTEQTANNTSPRNTSPRAPRSIEESSSTSVSPHSYAQPSRTPCSSLNTSCSSNSSPHIVPDTSEHFTPVMSDISERVEPTSANQDQTSSNSQTTDSDTQVISSQEHGVSPSIESVVSPGDQNDHIDTHSCSPNNSSHTTNHNSTERIAEVIEEVNHHQTERETNDLVNSDITESKLEEVEKEVTKEEGEKPAEEEGEKPAEEETSPPKEEEKKNPKKFSFNWADEVEDSWDSMYDESGECLDPELKKQLDNTVGKVTFEEPDHDYYSYQAKDSSPVLINDAEYSHVIEIYDFPVSFKTQDLLSIFGNFQNTGFDIKWVDDTHALGVFATALIASEALNIDHPFLKTRPLTLATRASKAKALRITEALLPYKPRPETSAALARRLVSGALGLKVSVSREVREAEKQKLKDAKAKKRLAAKQREDAWEGTIV